MSPDLINLFIGLGVGSIVVALINGFFNRGSNKATAAKLVTDTTKVAHDMVREIADDLRADNDTLRALLDSLSVKFEQTDRTLDSIRGRLDRVVRELENVIPLLEQGGHPELLADHLRQVVIDAKDPT